jgi:hypothetical protein
MAHGFSAVKEMFLPAFAERFTAAGFVTLVFDFRFLGESAGEPRGQVFPHEQHEDFRNAITWLAQQPEVDPDRIGIWGTSYSGGHVLHLSAFDPRIKAAVPRFPRSAPGDRWWPRGRERTSTRWPACWSWTASRASPRAPSTN